MKKVLVLLGAVFFINLNCYAANLYNDDNYTMTNFWQENGKYEQKVMSVGYRLLNKNKIDKRVIFRVARNKKEANAYANSIDKSVIIYRGIFPYLDSDDELAAILAHEIAHNMDYHAGGWRIFRMGFSPKKYEKKADLKAIDYLVKANYNPLAVITVENKISGEGNYTSHPAGSERLLYEYEYILENYPNSIKNNRYINNPVYKNFKLVTAEAIEKKKEERRKAKEKLSKKEAKKEAKRIKREKKRLEKIKKQKEKEAKNIAKQL